MSRDPLPYVILVFFAVVLSGCAQTKSFQAAQGQIPARENERVLIMPTDVLIEELTAGGTMIPHAAWTQQAKGNVDQALDAWLQNRGLTVIRTEEEETATDEAAEQLLKLHEAVGGSIIVHKYVQQLALPTKKDRFDWSLGKGAAHLAEVHDADYALFIYFRDSFSTSGRAALIVVGALLGVSIQGGQQIGFASLVDLSDGDIVWFNVLGSATGDLRDGDRAQDATASLLSELPL